MVLGVRPECLSLTAPGDGHMAGTIFTTELTGEAVLVTAQIGPARVIARTERGFSAATNANVGLRADRRQLHLFDAESGLRLPEMASRLPELVPGE